jgi:hypothetical protein
VPDPGLDERGRDHEGEEVSRLRVVAGTADPCVASTAASISGFGISPRAIIDRTDGRSSRAVFPDGSVTSSSAWLLHRPQAIGG